ncbi:MAG: 1-deoxy-D-xylulose-5-phosphate synthase, partial [Ruminococcus sp.]|nr:1-deoxy-D-xylulose-5-phosphate synthase [Ruminococcus sp.]
MDNEEHHYKFLDKIDSPDDLKKLSIDELYVLCDEIRDMLVKVVSQNGGHLSPNLGTVELTVALHYVYDLPRDSIVWDVGHQSYTHKILTGRRDKMTTIRKEGGLSGFPKRSESKYDSFNVGHSSTSISAAYGIARAKHLKKDTSKTIAVIGDGALTGGLAYEGLNNAGRSPCNFTVVLNDNKMSISRNVGSIAWYLTHIRIRPGYIKTKKIVEKILLHTPVIGNPIRKLLLSSKSQLRISVYRNTIFEDLGFVYYGPVDGHDLRSLIHAFNASKNVTQGVLIHVITKKGKGYCYAENDPKTYHGVGKFDIDTGEPVSSRKGYSAKFGEAMCDFASKDEKLCAITAAMTSGTGLTKFAEKYKERFFDVGIAEEHAVTFACGMAVQGMTPVFAVYSTFLQRSYDQIIHDAAQQKVHIVLAIDRAGIVGDDG